MGDELVLPALQHMGLASQPVFQGAVRGRVRGAGIARRSDDGTVI